MKYISKGESRRAKKIKRNILIFFLSPIILLIAFPVLGYISFVVSVNMDIATHKKVDIQPYVKRGISMESLEPCKELPYTPGDLYTPSFEQEDCALEVAKELGDPTLCNQLKEFPDYKNQHFDFYLKDALQECRGLSSLKEVKPNPTCSRKVDGSARSSYEIIENDLIYIYRERTYCDVKKWYMSHDIEHKGAYKKPPQVWDEEAHKARWEKRSDVIATVYTRIDPPLPATECECLYEIPYTVIKNIDKNLKYRVKDG